MVSNINSEEFEDLVQAEGDNLEIIDVREPDEYQEIRIKGSKLIPMGEIANRADEIDWNKKVIVVCRSGNRSDYIAGMLAENGKEVINLDGGILDLVSRDCEQLEKG